MDYQEIKKLLDKYWEGETSVEEEASLKAYFNGGNVADDLKSYQPFFQHFSQAQSMATPAGFDEKLIQALEQAPQEEPVKVRKRFVMQSWLRVAALVLLTLGVYQLMFDASITKNDQLVWEDTYEDPEQAYRETLDALKLVSKKMNKGKKETSKGLFKMKQTQKMVKKKID